MKKVLNSRGISTIEILLASALLLGFVLTLAFVGKSFKQFVASSEETVKGVYVHSHFISQMRNVLLKTRDAAGVPTQGLCGIAKTDAKKFGVAVIQLDLTKPSLAKLFSQTNWNKYRPKGWRESKKSGCSKYTSPFHRCYEPDKSQLGEEKGLKNLHVLAEIIPINLDPNSTDKLFKPISLFTQKTKSLDAKKVAFEMSVKTFYQKKRVDEVVDHTDTMKELIWSADAGECEFSGMRLVMSGTGIGDPSGKFVYGSTGFGGQLPPPVNVTILRKAIQEGQRLHNGSITTDPSKNISLSCTERTFQCRNNNNPRSFDDKLETELQVRYFTPNSVGELPLVDLDVDTKFISSSSSKDLLKRFPASSPRVFISDQQFVKVSDGNFYAYDEATNKYDKTKPMALAPGDQVVTLKYNNADKMCQKICDTKQTNTNYFPQYSLTLKKLRNSLDYIESINSPEPIGCTVCYTKSCKRFGLATFGAMAAQPNEPYDSRVPECSLKAAGSRSLDPLQKSKVSDKSGDCVAARITGNGRISYETRSCNEKLPVLCYNYGTHFLAIDQSVKTANLAKVKFQGAQRRCYQTGQETIKPEALTNMFTQFSSPHEVPDDFPEVFVNNASQGIFLAPESSNQIRDLIRHISNEQKIHSSSLFWVGYKKDSGGNFVAHPPTVSNVKNSEKDRYAVFFDEGGTPRVSKNLFGLAGHFQTGASSSAAILMNSLHWQGTLWVNSTQKNSFQFLCRKGSNDFFTSNRKSNQIEEGSEICSKEGGYFAPPISAMDWVEALSLVNPPSQYQPFPESDISKVEQTDFPVNPKGKRAAAWVALESSDQGNTYEFPTQHHVNSKAKNKDWTVGDNEDEDKEVKAQNAKYKSDLEKWEKKKEEHDKYLEAKKDYEKELKDWEDSTDSPKPPKPQPPAFVSSPGPKPTPKKQSEWYLCSTRSAESWTARKKSDGCDSNERQVLESEISGIKNITKYLRAIYHLDHKKDVITF